MNLSLPGLALAHQLYVAVKVGSLPPKPSAIWSRSLTCSPNQCKLRLKATDASARTRSCSR
jgi:hypothetical protein